ncbi:hypothetical protein Neosp_009715 [[Neocosmospora] mangrovei]
MTLGPWARSYSPSEAAITGVFDQFNVYEDEGKNFTYSEHCEMSGTVAQVPGEDNEEFTFVPYPVTITRGLDLLVAAESTSNKVTATVGTEDDATGAVKSEETHTKGSASETEASRSATATEESSAGVSRIPSILTAVAAITIATTVLL